MTSDSQFFTPPVYQLQVLLTRCSPLREGIAEVPQKFQIVFQSSFKNFSQNLNAAQEITVGSGKNVFVTATSHWVCLMAQNAVGSVNIERIYDNNVNFVIFDLTLANEQGDKMYKIEILISACEIGRRVSRSICENFMQTIDDFSIGMNIGVQTETHWEEEKRVNNAFVQVNMIDRIPTVNNSTQTEIITTTEKIIINENDVRCIFYQLIVFFARKLHEKFNQTAKIKHAASKDKCIATEIAIPTNKNTIDALPPIAFGSNHAAMKARLRNLIKVTRIERSANVDRKIRKLRSTVPPSNKPTKSHKSIPVESSTVFQSKNANLINKLTGIPTFPKEARSPKSAQSSISDKHHEIDDDLESLASPTIHNLSYSRSVKFVTNPSIPTPTSTLENSLKFDHHTQISQSNDDDNETKSESSEESMSDEDATDSEAESQSASGSKSISEEINSPSNSESQSSIAEELATIHSSSTHWH